jgi:FAD/FMN-containing dehydrogenase
MNPLMQTAPPGAVFPEDDGWDDARQAWNLAVDQQPAAVVVPERADDVVEAIHFARRNGLRVAMQGTGHGASPLGSLADSVLVKTHRMNNVQIDAERRRARVGAGAIWEQVVEPATGHGLTALHGSSPDVGVVGYTLGGGVGWFARQHGLAANSVTAVELVTADGDEVRVDADNEPDLFWGLRGGGGNFGAVTAVELELYPVEQAYAGWLVWPWERSRDVLARWAELTETFPETLSSLARILRLPPLEFIPEPFRGRDLVVVEAVHLGGDESGRELLRPLRELGPEMDTFATIPAIELTRLHQDPEGPVPGAGDGCMFDRLTPECIDAYLEVAGPGSDSPLVSTEIRQLGGALAKPAPGGGALSHLDAGFAQYAVGMAMSPEMAAAVVQRATLVKGMLDRHGRGRAYMNFAEHATDPACMFDEHAYLRLRALKSEVDPGRVFRASQEIPPLR